MKKHMFRRHDKLGEVDSAVTSRLSIIYVGSLSWPVDCDFVNSYIHCSYRVEMEKSQSGHGDVHSPKSWANVYGMTPSLDEHEI